MDLLWFAFGFLLGGLLGMLLMAILAISGHQSRLEEERHDQP